MDHHPVAMAQGRFVCIHVIIINFYKCIRLIVHVLYYVGTESLIKTNPGLVQLCETVSSSSTVCNKDTGEGSKLRMWSRGHFFIVRPCGHIDQWHPIYRYLL